MVRYRSASLTDYSIYNGSNSSNTLSYQLATNHQKPNIECSYETNSAYYTYDNSANGLHQKSTEAHNKSNNSSQQQKMLSKGGKNRNANILSAVLCLIKELDFASLEVVETAIHCRMEEMDN
ncbi:hypothetical protein B4U80_01330 [Leptotrombidium deliense]|uniref:Uncharacterized protein n=1 Tax=Leptotrombidium deliense TaxID=299467 RepID=A0A443SIT5_9ACAR|nr:hypothetical protein B4U80_01330 [Leptotrombidium deliense]